MLRAPMVVWGTWAMGRPSGAARRVGQANRCHRGAYFLVLAARACADQTAHLLAGRAINGQRVFWGIKVQKYRGPKSKYDNCEQF